MKTSTTTTTEHRAAAAGGKRRLPGWLWFVLLWMGGVAGAVALGYAFKIFMNLTLFAVTR
ncbi:MULTISPECIES: hypothetical protein [unclassified Burkholderia]|uniref:hypothetical protein n=1 Tax=unclassified Burkholderia TaxID=2613784 RepID=UPI0004690209|nr:MULTISPECIES: hypothetical protein [unclassified Burkholderia]NIE84829.1 hypothetical protein [Burkholderia sp. Tr-860]NIF62783.1 hypothetical protein [Burkholderia sp. Cy-647]NIF73126.1 hypothetical protein [Burkholderia sp. Ap-962]NIF88616.1 hypothetical protein [Burkholderia sp. Cy-637]NIF95580.1 hypothetical protein [Burkholderia sp. Ax-1720]